MKVDRAKDMLHPILLDCISRIQSKVIDAHKLPFKVFETGRDHDRHQDLILKGKTLDIASRHLYNLQEDPPTYATAVDYVFYNGKWSWNLRDNTIIAWYNIFGNLVLDMCPELSWGGSNRKSVKYDHFQLRDDIIIENADKYPCNLVL